MTKIILPDNTAITGTHGVGKTTTIQALEKRLEPGRHIITYDQARHFLEANRWHSDTITDEQRVELQMNTCARYIGAIVHATKSRLKAVLDGSLIEAKAYSQGVLPEDTMKHIDRRLSEYKHHLTAFVIPPTIPLVDDGLRFTNKEFRIEIHRRIMQIILEHEIPYHIVTSQSVEDRAEEIISVSLQDCII